MMRGSKKLVLAALAANGHIMNPSCQGAGHSSRGGEHVGPRQCEEAESTGRKSEAGRANQGLDRASLCLCKVQSGWGHSPSMPIPLNSVACDGEHLGYSLVLLPSACGSLCI